jgi:bifunctional UDP-N-acetylglucosamine pyrophosphorylase/glucosamine-1-phosphate N-acetyltransferase
MLQYVYAALELVVGAERVHTVVGYRREEVEQAFPERARRFIVQREQLGTGHALQVAWAALQAKSARWLLVANGDTPLLRQEHLARLTSLRDEGASLAFLTVTPENPGQLGRVVRGEDGGVQAIIEAKDYDASLHGQGKEVNAGVYLFDMERIAPLLGELKNSNKSGEYYVTDLVGLTVARGLAVRAVCCGDDPGLLGVNTAQELCDAEELLRVEILGGWRRAGVVARQSESIRIGPRAKLAPGVDICGPVEIYGESRLGSGVQVQSHVVLQDAVLDGCIIKNFSHIDGAVVHERCQVGPFARLRPGTELHAGARIGNFVEAKKTVLGEGAKASHLTYLGDAVVGAKTNIGAGTITCNYDGANKHVTHIETGVFVGSNTALVAPVRLGAGSLVAAGSTITQDVPPGCRAFGRSRQKNVKTDKEPC